MSTQLHKRIQTMKGKERLPQEARMLIDRAEIAYMDRQYDDALRYIVMAETIMDIELLKDTMSIAQVFKEVLEAKVKVLEDEGIKNNKIIRMYKNK